MRILVRRQAKGTMKLLVIGTGMMGSAAAFDMARSTGVQSVTLADADIERAQEAANFNKECAAIKSPFAATCAKNLAAIRSQYRGLK